MSCPPFGIVTVSTIGPVPLAAQIAPADGVQDHDVNVMPEGGVSVNVAPATSAMFSPSRFFTTTV